MKKTRILLVEDETIVARDIENMLVRLGYDVSEVLTTGKDAVEMAKKLRPALVLMDVMLQGKMNGIEAAHRVYKDLSIPVVYITAYADEKTLQRAKLTEPFGYIVKPFNEKELQTSIEIALYKYKMETEHREKERWLSTVLENIGDAVIATDKEGKITFMNTLAEKLTGWREEDASNKHLKRIFRIKSEKSDKTLKISLEEVIAGKKFSLPNNVYLISKRGIRIPIDLRIVSLSNDREVPAGVILTFTDISHRKKTEQELKLSWKKIARGLGSHRPSPGLYH